MEIVEACEVALVYPMRNVEGFFGLWENRRGRGVGFSRLGVA